MASLRLSAPTIVLNHMNNVSFNRNGWCVREMSAQDAARWDEFVAHCEQATFFHRAGWREIMQGVFKHNTCFLLAEKDGVIGGVLPLAEVKSRLFGHAMVSLPFCVYGGVAATDPEAAEALELAAIEVAQGRQVEHLELRNITPRHEDWPTQDLYFTFRKEILPEEEANMLAIPRKQRAMVRKGIGNGLRAEIDETPDRFFELYADNVQRHGTPALPKRYFAELKRIFGEQCEFMLVLDQAGTPISTVLTFYFKDECMPYYAGDALAARDLAANDFKYWDLMRRACARGCKVFDYGRSKRDTGQYSFKKNWGFEPTPLNYQYQLFKREAIPQNNPNNPKYRLFIEAWKRLPRVVANTLGPHIVRNLG